MQGSGKARSLGGGRDRSDSPPRYLHVSARHQLRKPRRRSRWNASERKVRRKLFDAVMHALEGCDPFEPLMPPWPEGWTHASLREGAAAIVLAIKTRPSIIRNCACVTIVTELRAGGNPSLRPCCHYSDVANLRDEGASSVIETGSVSALLASRRGGIKAHPKSQRPFTGPGCPVNRIKQKRDHNDRTGTAESDSLRLPLSGARPSRPARSIGCTS
jgi:hypothetical protein